MLESRRIEIQKMTIGSNYRSPEGRSFCPNNNGEFMNIVVFGANGPTGLELCRQALAAGHHVTAAVRRPDDFPLRDNALNVVLAHVMDGSSLAPVIGNADVLASRDPRVLGWDEGYR
jgi:NADPH-dependent 2,4-dienoyl-CoA reductase/sulfur reductase-like enzyme